MEPQAGVKTHSKKSILIVDDEQVVCDVLEEFMVMEGHTVTAFTDPAKALETLKISRPPLSVALFDLSMPGMNGNSTDMGADVNKGSASRSSKSSIVKTLLRYFVLNTLHVTVSVTSNPDAIVAVITRACCPDLRTAWPTVRPGRRNSKR